MRGVNKPYAAAAENNKNAILAALTEPLSGASRVLEIGAGTGQHAVHFARALPHLAWQTSDLATEVAGIRMWCDEAALPNLPSPLILDVRERPWPVGEVDAVYAANTVHYMAWSAVAALYAGLDSALSATGTFFLYGPFNYNGTYTSDGNRRLDLWLRGIDSAFAIRDVAELTALAARHGFALVDDVEMPANNRLLWWRRAPSDA